MPDNIRYHNNHEDALARAKRIEKLSAQGLSDTQISTRLGRHRTAVAKIRKYGASYNEGRNCQRRKTA